jgi:hypothetical protein
MTNDYARSRQVRRRNFEMFRLPLGDRHSGGLGFGAAKVAVTVLAGQRQPEHDSHDDEFAYHQ